MLLTVTYYFLFFVCFPVITRVDEREIIGRKSTELKIRAVKNIGTLLQNGKSFGKVACSLKIPKSTMYFVWKKLWSHGSVECKHNGRRKLEDERAARKLVIRY